MPVPTQSAAPDPVVDLDHRWVPAADFAAHLRHLLTTTGAPWRVLAMAAGVSPLTVGRLLGMGRPLPRIRAADARRLLLLSGDGLAGLELRLVGSAGTVTRIEALMTAGLSPAEICEELALSREELVGLLTGASRRCTAMVRLRARAACEKHRLWTCCDAGEGAEPEEAA